MAISSAPTASAALPEMGRVRISGAVCGGMPKREKTGASSATISRVNHSLQYGANGYEIVFGRMEKKDGGEQNGEEEN